MLFTLEVLKAKKGDSLLLHLGDAADPVLWVIDGGPSGVYRQSLRPRLEALRADRVGGGSLPIHLLMVSHIDDDHIRGVLDLTNTLRQQREDSQDLDYRIRTLWHNSFDDVVGEHAEELLATATAQVGAASLAGEIGDDLEISRPAALVLASVPQGRDLRNNANFLGLEVNEPGGGLIFGGDGTPVDPPLAPGLETIVVGPTLKRLRELQEDWDEKLREKGLAQVGVEAAAYLDESVYNLASLVVLLRAGEGDERREMLLTGDARGDDVLEGMAEAGLLDEAGHRHVDLLKMPHHGSDRNVEVDFFRAITADRYVFSGDGAHGNPELATFEMIFEARADDAKPFTLYLTYEPEEFKADRGKPYPVAELRDLFERQRQAGRAFEVITPAADDLSLTIDLLEPYRGA